METIFLERFVYATIVPTKNYCKLSEKTNSLTTFNNDIEYINDDDDIFTSKNIRTGGLFIDDTLKTKSRTIVFGPKDKKKKTKYFYNNSNVGERLEVCYAYLNKSKTSHGFDTTKDRHIKAHYGNPFSEVRITLIERSIKRNGDKVTIKIYRHTKRRDVNWIYFRKSSMINSITINLKTGNFTIIDIQNDPNKSTKRFRKNCFYTLRDFCLKNNGLFKIKQNQINKHSNVYSEYESAFDDFTFSLRINEALDFNFVNYSHEPGKFMEGVVSKFVEWKKIKVPNEYKKWLTELYPTEKYLKKNDRKLLLSILDMFQIKSKITNKILHTYTNIDIVALSKLCYLFGSDYSKYIGSISIDRFEVTGTNGLSGGSIDKNGVILHKNHKFYITDTEKENIVKLLNNTEPHYHSRSNLTVNNQLIGELYDHFKMIDRIREYDPELKFRAKTYTEFHEEHLQLSKIIGAIGRGWVIEYQFNEDMIKDMEKPVTIKINIGDDDNPNFVSESFYPLILKREEEYVEEGNFMHHCVASYADKDKSVIISVRNDNGTDRVTCEFDAQSGEMIQCRHFCNKQAPGDFELAVDELKTKVKYYSRRGMFGSIDKKKVPVKINGVEVKPQKPTPTLMAHLFPELPY